MSSTAYRLIGFVVWRALKWYLRELVPSRRRIVLSLAAVPRRRRRRRRVAAPAGGVGVRALPSRPSDAPSACGLNFQPA